MKIEDLMECLGQAEVNEAKRLRDLNSQLSFMSTDIRDYFEQAEFAVKRRLIELLSCNTKIEIETTDQ